MTKFLLKLCNFYLRIHQVQITFKKGITMNDRYLSVAEICTYLGIKRDTVYKWISKKELPAHRVEKLWEYNIQKMINLRVH